MRKMDWEGPLSDEDIAWLRQTGQPGMEERIERHQSQYGGVVPPDEFEGDDGVTRSALDPTARTADPAVTGDGPLLVDPTDTPDEEELDGADYDTWSKAELEGEVAARNVLPDTSEVTVTGTGKDGAVLKADLVKGLHLWDNENPDAL